MIHEVMVKKEYRHRRTGDTKVLSGTFRSMLTREQVGVALAKSLIQTIDSRIEWDENFEEGDGWDYIDWSFDLDDELIAPTVLLQAC